MSLPSHINITKTPAVYETVQQKQVSRKVIKTVIQPEIRRIVTPAKTIKEINHQVVEYRSQRYVVCYCPYKDENKLFVTDYQDDEFYDNLIHRSWHYRVDGDYIASCELENDVKKELYLHNYVLGKMTFNGKGQHHTIDHKNRIGRDNRIINLRELTQSHQNINQSKRKRIIELPEDCEINPNDIPKNIYYKPASGAHGEQFYIEIRTPEIVKILTGDDDKIRYRWFGTKIKSVDLRVKLQQAIMKLQELKTLYPEIADFIGSLNNDEERNELITSFNEILDLTSYPREIIDANKGELIKINETVPIEEIQDQIKTEIEEKTIHGKKSFLPNDCEITPQMIPKYCYYRPACDKRGDKFIIDRHPSLVKTGLRQWATTETRKLSTKEKYDLLIKKLEELENNI